MKTTLPTRRLIPKWRRVRHTLVTNEVPARTSKQSLGRTSPSAQALASDRLKPDDPEEFERAVSLWHDHHEAGVLVDILSFSMRPELVQRIVDIGNQAIKLGAPVTPAQRFIIKQLGNQEYRHPEILGFDDETSPLTRPFEKLIREMWGLLRNDPSNSLALLDFAQLQAAIGRNEVAEKVLRTALGLIPNSRLVLRTLARFYVHDGKPDRAHALLRRPERTAHDPWLIASEIALADVAGAASAFLSKGRRMLIEAGKSPSRNFSELAGSIAMAELCAGNLKKARELQRIALLDPTDNVAAQAVDRQVQFGIALTAPNIELAIASSAEAGMLRSWLDLEPRGVEKHALQWHQDEPFSSRPIQILTGIYAYQGNTEQALRWLKVGLQSEPTDRGLLINLAYTHARAGNLDEALQPLLKARRLYGTEVEPFLLATEGLLSYHRGKFNEGDELYSRAIELFNSAKARQLNVSTFCLLNQAIVALELRHPNAAKIVASTNEAMKTRPSSDAIMLLKIAAEPMGETDSPVVAVPAEEQRQRLTSQWVFDPQANTLSERQGLTAPGAKPIVLLENVIKRT